MIKKSIVGIIIGIGIIIGYNICNTIYEKFTSSKRKWDKEQTMNLIVIDKRTGHDMKIIAGNYSTIEHYDKCEKCKKEK